ncbi:MAG: molybdopterin-dependent oxidoreductase [Paucibacter sp.]|nr:molybdopterin-dependent oxidoreductase [Roseateles sp.]
MDRLTQLPLRRACPAWTRRLFCAAAVQLAVGNAYALEAPSGAVVLTVNGGGVSGEAKFDIAMLAALPQQSFKTKTPWYPAARKFTGPLLRDVLAAAGARGQVIEAIAINDYKVSIPIEDALQRNLIVARLLDDKPMTLRDKGPLFIIYPFDADESLRNSLYYSRAAWQLKALRVK